MRADPDRIFDITVCLRPFRAAGPRLDTETIGSTLVVHNDGHGGSFWSLSWGSAAIAVRKAMANSPTRLAVLGCGALCLTSAIVAQRAGAQVTIYARDRLPQTRMFHSPAALDTLPEKTVINCPGYGGRALWNDASIVPVRGQIAWLIPQPEID